MLSEKPWRKEFDKLIQDMTAHWGGQITNFEKPEDRDLDLTSLYVYPIYKAKIDNYAVHVTISEFPLPGGGIISAADNVEYISVFLVVPCSFTAAIRHEHLIDRFKKKLGLENEVQTGNEEFDKKYFLITALNEDVSKTKLNQDQRKIMDLEPFDGLHVSKGGINLTQMINDKNILKVQNVETIVKRMIALADLVQVKG